jgi:hypothetical protein
MPASTTFALILNPNLLLSLLPERHLLRERE